MLVKNPGSRDTRPRSGAEIRMSESASDCFAGQPADKIILVDDDAAVRKALSRALRQEGWTVEAFDSAEAFLARPHAARPACLVLDVTMPGLDGLDLQQELTATGQPMPIVFVSGHGDIPMSVRAIKAGAEDFLTKPVKVRALIDAVRGAIARDVSHRAARAELAELERRRASLTPREREVLAAIVRGRLNKQIAGDMGIVEQTVKFHRARIMERMQVRTVAELMHLVARLDIEGSASTTGRRSPPADQTAPGPPRS